MSILVLNLGSTSFKFELFDSDSLDSLKKGEFELEADENGVNQGEIDRLFREALRQVGDVSQLKAVGHRIVHGGSKYLEAKEINTQEIYELEKLKSLAPLHNPYNLAGIKSSNKYLPEVPDFAVFDTAFFKDLPERAKIYPLPYKYYEELNIHKFGFHGISHKFAGQEAAREIKVPFNRSKLITLHLGGGCSITAIEKGKPIDTSMGLTPLEGLMMMTRPGDVDSGAVLELLKQQNEAKGGQNLTESLNELDKILNYESGIYGISGRDDYLNLLKAANFGEKRAKLAFEMFIYRIKKYIGAYLAVLGGADAIVFTGQIGAGRPITRKKICDGLKIIEKIPIIVVKPHEELAIAREIKNLLD